MANLSDAFGKYYIIVNGKTDKNAKIIKKLLLLMKDKLDGTEYSTHLDIFDNLPDMSEKEILNQLTKFDMRNKVNTEVTVNDNNLYAIESVFYGNGRWEYSRNVEYMAEWMDLYNKTDKQVNDFFKELGDSKRQIITDFNNFEPGCLVYYDATLSVKIDNQNIATFTELSYNGIEPTYENLIEDEQINQGNIEFFHLNQDENLITTLDSCIGADVMNKLSKKKISKADFIESVMEYLEYDVVSDAPELLSLEKTAIQEYKIDDLIDKVLQKII